jgi:hypothetical protein
LIPQSALLREVGNVGLTQLFWEGETMETATRKAFADMPDEFRMTAREIVDNAGGMVAGYWDGICQVALPADDDACREMTRALESMGLVGSDRFLWFPLGTDKPPESMRHFGFGSATCPRGDRPGYWKYRNFHVAD